MMFTLFTITTVSLSGCGALQTAMDQLALTILRGLYMLIYPVAGLLVLVSVLSVLVYVGAYFLPDWIPFRGQTVGRGFMLRLITALIVMVTAIVLVVPLRTQIGNQIAQLGYRIEQGGGPGVPTNP
jgi:hypothetical protein